MAPPSPRTRAPSFRRRRRAARRRPTIRARVVTPSGAVHWLDPNTIAESPIPTLTSDIYSDARLLRAPLPAVAPGVIVEQEILVRERAPVFDGGVVERVHFGWIKVPVGLTRLEIEAPSALHLKWVARLLPDLQPETTESAGLTKLVFQRTHLAAVETPEPFTPAEVPLRPHVVLATSRSWAAVAAGYWAVVQKQIAAGPISSISAEAAGGASERVEIVRRMLDYVTRRIRYTGVEFGIAGIVPGAPAETLKRGYGDCKDQASLLVSMLRDAGVDAQVALLNAGFGEDIEPELPGLGGFNHAIVYVPGAPAIWVDPTDRYGRAGVLPSADRGRWALVASPATGGLVRLPDADPGANRTVEAREVFLSEQGPGKLIETTEWFGSTESRSRAIYASANPKELREYLEGYLKDLYLADRLVSMEHSQPQDLSTPFRVRLETHGVKVAMAADSEAFVAIRLRDLAQPLRAILDANAEGKLASRSRRSASSQRGAASQRHFPLQLPESLLTEWRYTIVPPNGFQAHDLPAPESTSYGPAKLSTRFEKKDDMTVTATLQFEVVKQQLSPEQVDELQDQLDRLDETPPLLISFESIGESHLKAGHLREAVEEFDRLAALHPTEARHRAQRARALLAGGLGDAARSEARAAISLEPGSAEGHRALGWVLEHDAIGRRFGAGSDRAGALEAYRKAKSLDPDDLRSRVDLATLLEHDAEGLHFGPDAAVDEALAEYRDIRKALDEKQADESILSALFHSGRYDETRQLARSLDPTAEHRAYILASVAASGGPAAAQAEASRVGGDPTHRREVLWAAARLLLETRNYPASASLMTEALKGSISMGPSLQLADLVRKGQRFDPATPKGNDPRNVVKRLILTALDPRPDTKSIQEILSVSMRSAAGGETGLKELRRGGWMLQNAFQELDLPWTVSADLVLSALELDVDGGEAVGYRVKPRSLATGMPARFAIYLVSEQGRLLVWSFGPVPGRMGQRALNLVQSGDLEGARRWLDWFSDDSDGLSYDPLSAIAFSGLWKAHSNAARNQILYAAASLVAESQQAEEAIPILKAARALNISEADRLYVDLARARAYLSLRKYTELLELAQWLVKMQPQMGAAFSYLAAAHAGLKQWPQLREAARERLVRRPDDQEALQVLASAAARLGDLKEEESTLKKLTRRERPDPGDLNDLAWLSLCNPPIGAESIGHAERAVMMTGQSDGDYLHTLAALYAESGRHAEAHQMLLRAMAAEGIDEPRSEHWFVLGQIAAGIGQREAALAAFAKVTPTPDEDLPGQSAYELARRRMNKLAPAPASAR